MGDHCDLWDGPLYSNGYGRDGKRPAHVVAWTAVHGPVPDGFVLDHECHNADPHCAGGKSCPHRRCRNVEHLVLRTIGDNVRRGFRSRATCSKGHPWTEENTYRPPRGRRQCRTCMDDRARARYELHGDELRRKARERMRRNHQRKKELANGLGIRDEPSGP